MHSSVFYSQRECIKPDTKEQVCLSKLSYHPTVWSSYNGVETSRLEMSSQSVHMTQRCDLSSQSLARQVETPEIIDVVTSQ